MLYIDVNSTIATLDEKLDREYLHLIASLFGPKHLEIISRDMEKKDRGLRLAATNLIVFCIQYGFAYGLANNSRSFEDAAGHEAVEKIYDPYVLNLKLFKNGSNISLCNFIVVKRGEYYEKITNQWRQSGPCTTLSAYIRATLCDKNSLPDQNTLTKSANGDGVGERVD